MIRATNHRLKKTKNEKQKKEKIVEWWKIKAMAAKRCKARRKMSAFSIKEENYESITKDDTNSDKANNKHKLHL